MQNDLIQFGIFLVALLVTMTVHEASHAAAAYYLGDPTAKLAGRLTLNPIKHLDPIGSIVFLLTQRIGWGKPVPVNPANFKSPIRDNALTALAGPMSNFLLAFFIALPLKYLNGTLPEEALLILWMLFHVSIFLGIFNLFPFPPLDGSNIIGLFVPGKYHRKYISFLQKSTKYFIAIILVDVFILGEFLGFSILGSAIRFLHDVVATVLLLGT